MMEAPWVPPLRAAPGVSVLTHPCGPRRSLFLPNGIILGPILQLGVFIQCTLPLSVHRAQRSPGDTCPGLEVILAVTGIKWAEVGMSLNILQLAQ